MDEFVVLPSTEQLLRIALATLVGAAIGFERELRGQAAGLRTMILVCLGSTLAMLVSAELSHPETGQVAVDPSRIAAGIVTGVGFLGAGVIVKLGDVVHGVTTAAAIWFVAAIGIAIGSGHYGLAVSATALALVVLALLRYPERLIKGHAYRVVTIVASSEHAQKVLEKARSLLESSGQTMLDVQGSNDLNQALTSVEFYVRTTEEVPLQTVLFGISQIEGVKKVSWRAPQG